MNAQGEPGSMGKGHVLSLASIVWGGGGSTGRGTRMNLTKSRGIFHGDVTLTRDVFPEYVKHLEGEEALQACRGSKVVNVELVLYEWMGCMVNFAYGLGIAGN